MRPIWLLMASAARAGEVRPGRAAGAARRAAARRGSRRRPRRPADPPAPGRRVQLRVRQVAAPPLAAPPGIRTLALRVPQPLPCLRAVLQRRLTVPPDRRARLQASGRRFRQRAERWWQSRGRRSPSQG